MKKIVYLLLLLFAPPALAQTIQNADFEITPDTNRTLPVDWRVDSKTGYTVALDSTVAKRGRRSIHIANLPNAALGQAGFSQSATVHLSEPALVHWRGFVKTDNPAGVGVWWNAWQDGKHKGFTHSSQQVNLRPTDEWQPFDLVLLTPTEINQFTFGAYLRGKGQVWFDDLRFEIGLAGSHRPSAKVRKYVDKAIRVVQQNALVRDSIAWPQTRADMLAFARGMTTEAEAHAVVRYLVDVLHQKGDNHSFFKTPQAVQQYSAAQPTDGDEPPKPQARFLGDGIGYVSVPAFGSVNQTRQIDFATTLQHLIRQIDQVHTPSGWVVDLRENGGGNMYPMIAGLGPLLGEDTLGYFVHSTRQVPWVYRSGETYAGKPGQGTKITQPYALQTKNVRVAVLIGPHTASSGEMTAISFMGRPNTRFFGLPSAGYTTANAGFYLPDGAQLYLASSVTADRTHKPYPKRLVPDESVTAPATGTADPTVDAAKVWLLKP